MIILTDGATDYDLPDDLDWIDEWAWTAVEQTMTRGLTGKPIVQYAARTAGRPITLEPPAGGAWMTRADFAAVAALADSPGKTMTLTIRGTAFTVMFRHDSGPAVDSRPVMFFSDPAPDHYVLPTFRFMTVS